MNASRDSSFPMRLAATPMAQASMAQARKRVIGPASASENSTPSGVRMTRRRCAALFTRASPHQEEEQSEQLDAAEGDLDRVGQHRLMILREERFHDPGPDQQERGARRDGEQVFRNGPHARAPRRAVAPADERARQHEAGLTG